MSETCYASPSSTLKSVRAKAHFPLKCICTHDIEESHHGRHPTAGDAVAAQLPASMLWCQLPGTKRPTRDPGPSNIARTRRCQALARHHRPPRHSIGLQKCKKMPSPAGLPLKFRLTTEVSMARAAMVLIKGGFQSYGLVSPRIFFEQKTEKGHRILFVFP